MATEKDRIHERIDAMMEKVSTTSINVATLIERTSNLASKQDVTSSISQHCKEKHNKKGPSFPWGKLIAAIVTTGGIVIASIVAAN